MEETKCETCGGPLLPGFEPDDAPVHVEPRGDLKCRLVARGRFEAAQRAGVAR